MKSVLRTVEKVAATDANVLILGNNGTGKELIAREIHAKSERAHEIFINVDLGALPESLFEAELFGCVKGAYTDAREDREGKFEIANKGTIFLDEIGNIPVQMQMKLLSFLQNKKISRLGSNKEIELDVRVICATNMPLQEMIETNKFRQDLYFRINTVEITLPDLNNRVDDIMPLAIHFLKHFAQKYQKTDLTFSKESQQQLMNYNYPGNIRELQHIIERAVIMAEKRSIKPADFAITNPQCQKQKNLLIKEIEKNTIMQAISKHNGNISKAAKEIGVGRATLYRKIKKYGF